MTHLGAFTIGDREGLQDRGYSDDFINAMESAGASASLPRTAWDDIWVGWQEYDDGDSSAAARMRWVQTNVAVAPSQYPGGISTAVKVGLVVAVGYWFLRNR